MWFLHGGLWGVGRADVFEVEREILLALDILADSDEGLASQDAVASGSVNWGDRGGGPHEDPEQPAPPPPTISDRRIITSVPIKHSATGPPLPSSPPPAICSARTERVHYLIYVLRCAHNDREAIPVLCICIMSARWMVCTMATDAVEPYFGGRAPRSKPTKGNGSKMKRLSVTSLLLALMVSGATATGVSAQRAHQAKPGSYTCQVNPTLPSCRATGGAAAAAAASAAANAAVAAAAKLSAAARACTPSTSARCQALASAAAAAQAHALQLVARAKALAAAAHLPVPIFPSTGAGGTAPVAGSAPVVSGLSSQTTSAVTSLPATGGAVPSSPDSTGLLALFGMMLALAGLGLRRRSI
jgi:hypothetical protein